LDEDPKLVDLEPHKWSSSDNREKPHEPMFGPGWPMAVGAVVGIFGAACAIHYGYGPIASGAAGIVGAVIGNALTAVFQK
jgi:hypothetical protein